MSRVCAVSKKKVGVGNLVSHANNRTKRGFAPNLQNVSFFSSILGFKIRLRICTSAIKTIEKFGGIDEFFKNVKCNNLNPNAIKLKKLVVEKSSAV